MTRDEIMALAREACDPGTVDAWKNGYWTLTQEELEHFAALVSAAEREACAKQSERMESALKVIHTWASVPNALVAAHVAALCAKTLGRKA